MHISKFKLANYKSFYEPEELALSPGFNIIVGPNNVGKTALLEALSLRFSSDPHRSLKTVPTPDAQPKPQAWAEISFTVSRDELLELLQANPGPYWLPYPQSNSEIANRTNVHSGAQPDLQRFVEAVMDRQSFTFDLRTERGGIQWSCAHIPSFSLYLPVQPQGIDQPAVRFEVGPNRAIKAQSGSAQINAQSEIGAKLGPIFEKHIYKFSAERFHIGRGGFGTNPELTPDASNLPEVLSTLQPNIARFEDFNRLVREILPQVRQVSVRGLPQSSNTLEVLLWTIDPSSRRIDLAQALQNSGTGIAQILAILYVALNSVRPQIIIIDEPQSFLHPGAIRKLIDVLKAGRPHQYILATHSPTVITSANPSTITLVRLDEGESRLQKIDPRETKAATCYLSEIGARLSDVFGADNFLWVEGATEETCFPAILEKIAKRSLMGTAIVGVRQVGDFESRDARRVLEIYNRLSQSKSLLPPAVGFVFDRECRTKGDIEDLSRLGHGRVHFLLRRMYENYLLDVDAIATVANGIQGFREPPVRPEEVEALILAKRQNQEYFCHPEHAGDSDDWRCCINGPKVLQQIFSELSQSRVTFEKTEHSPALTDWIIQNKPSQLEEIAKLLREVLDRSAALSPASS